MINFLFCFVILLNVHFSTAQPRKFIPEAQIDLGNGVIVYLKASVFDSSQHACFYCQKNCICRIDGMEFYGTDCDVPRTKLDSAKIQVRNKVYTLETSGMYNPWFSQPSKQFCRIEQTKSTLILRALFSDGAGAYIAEWQIKNNKVKRTILTNDERIMFKYF